MIKLKLSHFLQKPARSKVECHTYFVCVSAFLFSLPLFVFCVNSIYPHPAWGIVVDSHKQVYFSDLETIYKIDSQGKLTIFRAGESGRHVHDLSIDAEDNIYGLDNSYNQQTQKYPRSIWKMSPNGEFTYIIQLTDNLPLGMSIWRDFDGNTYSVEPYNNERRETKIIKRTPDGKTSLFAGGKYGYLDGQKDKAEFGVITDMAFGRDNAIYLTNDDKVRKIDKFGMVTTIFRVAVPTKNRQNPEPFSRLFGLEVDKQNNVFAADFDSSRLLKISSDGTVSTLLNSEKDWLPIGVAANGDEVYVLEARPYSSAQHAGNRVLKISPDGKWAIVANLEDMKKTSDLSNTNNNSLLKTNKLASTDNSVFKKSPLILLSIIGVVIAGFAAFFIFAKKKY